LWFLTLWCYVTKWSLIAHQPILPSSARKDISLW
jgi:hypothetical protein